MSDELKTIEGVEVFAAGKWNGDEYSINDLDDMVNAFNETNQGFKPYLKLGHNNEQELIQKDGLPAAGWVGRLYRKGEKLVADFVDLPEKIYQLLKKKAYRNFSSEIYWDINVNDKKYPRLLSGVALLGTDMPAVNNLDDILAWYGLTSYDKIKSYTDENASLKKYEYSNGGKMSDELKKEIEDLKAANDELQKKYTTLETEKKEVEETVSELDELRKTNEELTKSVKEFSQKAIDAQIDADIAELEKEELCTPAMKDYVKSLLGAEKKEYSFGEGEKEEKLSKKEILKKCFSLMKKASDVNFDDNSELGENGKEDDTQAKIEKYMSDNKVSYKQAYCAVINEIEVDNDDDNDEE